MESEVENGRGRRVEGEGRRYVGEIPGVRRGELGGEIGREGASVTVKKLIAIKYE